MSEIVLKVEGVGKKYIISHENHAGSYTALRDVISSKAKSLLNRGSKQLPKEEFWALRDVNFEIRKGDAVGIIGRNGAGKSTLLKILSRITEPTKGRIEINGRVASLLEVGTGFHPELTGRENIFLNGAILGMSRLEIRGKFDEIVEFSGVEKFLDTPVKRYSSGMYVRLAFAVAAHLEPEILVVDEVLAVGDAEFQKKCLGKMEDVSKKDGRTVLFVSHNMGAVASLCNNAILLNRGEVEGYGPASSIIKRYFSSSSNSAYSFDLKNSTEKHGDDIVELLSGQLHDSECNVKGTFKIDEEFNLTLKYRIKKSISASIVPNIQILNAQGECLFVCNGQDVQSLPEGEYAAKCTFPKNFLNDGLHFVVIAFITYYSTNYEHNFVLKNAMAFEIIDKLHDNPLRYNYVGPMPGYIRPNLLFKVSKI